MAIRIMFSTTVLPTRTFPVTFIPPVGASAVSARDKGAALFCPESRVSKGSIRAWNTIPNETFSASARHAVDDASRVGHSAKAAFAGTRDKLLRLSL